jgi:hypothetical protein
VPTEPGTSKVVKVCANNGVYADNCTGIATATNAVMTVINGKVLDLTLVSCLREEVVLVNGIEADIERFPFTRGFTCDCQV